MARQREVEPATSRRAVGQKAYALRLARAHDTVAQRLAEERVQPVLYRGDRDDRLRLPDLRGGDVRQTDPADLSRLVQTAQLPHALEKGHARIGRMELIQSDLIDAESAQRSIACR